MKNIYGELLELSNIQKVIDDIHIFKKDQQIYNLCFNEALKHNGVGYVYTYLDVRTGKVETKFLDNLEGSIKDDWFEIILCELDTPIHIDEFDKNYIINWSFVEEDINEIYYHSF